MNNIYNDEIVVCDVSSKNPNVMFELGLRLAFDKPTIIIKDEKTGYSFDTGVIEHLNYPSSLRFNNIVDFKKELVNKINATYQKSISDPEFSPFLKSFGKTIVPAKINSTEIPESKYILEKLELINSEIRFLKNNGQNALSILDNNKNDLNPRLKRKLTRQGVYEFIERNPHLDQSDLFVLSDNISDEIINNYGFIPNSSIISEYIQGYHTEKLSKSIK